MAGRTMAAGLLIASALACSMGCTDHTTGDGVPAAWGSNQAGLKIENGVATLQILADGNCYGSYAETGQPIPVGSFTLPGTFTQLTGAYPGRVQYSAELTGTVSGNQMAISVSVPALQRTIGPFLLGRGVAASWPACAYP